MGFFISDTFVFTAGYCRTGNRSLLLINCTYSQQTLRLSQKCQGIKTFLLNQRFLFVKKFYENKRNITQSRI